MIYRDFELLATNVEVVKAAGQKRVTFQVRVLKSPAGDNHESMPTGYDAREMRQRLQALERRALDWEGMICLGAWLGEILFPAPVRELLVRSLEHIEPEQTGVRIRLRLDGTLHNIPWEVALLNRGGGEATQLDLLGLMPNVSIVRHQAATLPTWDIQAKRPVRMVVGLASPARYAALNLDKEREVIKQAVSTTMGIEAEFIPDATRDTLLKAIPQCHLFHFAGHGDFENRMGAKPGTTEGKGSLILDDGYGAPQPIEAGELAVQLRQAGVRVAVLGACQSGRRDDVNVWSSIATALLKAELGAVVGMQYTIKDDNAIAFAKAFYRALLAGLPIDEAVTQGRVAVAAHDPRDWAVPVLYLRAEDGVVFPEYAQDPALAEAQQDLRVKFRARVKEVYGSPVFVDIGNLYAGSLDVEMDVDTWDGGGSMLRIGTVGARPFEDYTTGDRFAGQAGAKITEKEEENNFQMINNDDIPGIAPETYRRLRKTLLKCGPFSDDEELRAIFVDQRLAPWHDEIPQARAPASRARKIIEWLHNQHNDNQENVLVLLLRVLSELKEPGNACHRDLVQLAAELEHTQPGSNSPMAQSHSGENQGKAMNATIYAQQTINTQGERASASAVQLNVYSHFKTTPASLRRSFDALMKDKLQGFVGRQFVFEALDDFLHTHDSGYFILRGVPGIGKSAFMAKLVNERGYIHHFNIASQNIRSTRAFLENVIAQLIAHYDLPHAELPPRALEDSGFLVQCLSEAAEKRKSSEERIVIAIDALDEADRLGLAAAVNTLYLPPSLPMGVYIVVTTRPLDDMRLQVMQPQVLDLEADSEGNLQDITTYIEIYAQRAGMQARLAAWGVSQAQFVAGLRKKSQGNFIYLYYVLPAIEKGEFIHGTLDELPDGLMAYYQRHWRQMREGNEAAFDTTYEPIVCILGVAQEPVTVEQIANWTKLRQGQVKENIRRWREFLEEEQVEGERRYRIYHDSLRDFLRERLGKDIHQQIVDYYFSIYHDDWASCDDEYAVQNLRKHVEEAKTCSALYCLIQDEGWYAVQAKNGISYYKFVPDLEQAFEIAVRQKTQGWSNLIGKAWIRATISGIARYLPDEAYETLVRLGSVKEAQELARIIPEKAKRARVLQKIKHTAQELTGSPIPNAVPQSSIDGNWIVNSISRIGVKKTLDDVLHRQPTLDPDSSETTRRYLAATSVSFQAGETETIRRYLAAAPAFFQAGASEAAHTLLLKSLDLIGQAWDDKRRNLLPEIAQMLVDFGYSTDLNQVLNEALEIELEEYRLMCLVELAVICADTDNTFLKTRSLVIAVEHVEKAERRSALQFEISKLALAMAKMDDNRAEEFLQRALALAERPIQPIGYYQEKGAWQNLAGSFIFVGMLDEALNLLDHNPHSVSDIDILVGLALHNEWETCNKMLEEVSPTRRDDVALDILHTLTEKGKANTEHYQSLFTQVETNLLGLQYQRSHHLRLGRLIDIALHLEEKDKAGRYLEKMLQMLKGLEDGQQPQAIQHTARYAVKLQAVTVVHKLIEYARGVPEDNDNHRSYTLATVAWTLAKLAAIEDGWALAKTIPDESKRLETYVNICRVMQQQGRDTQAYFFKAFEFAQQIENVGWVPTSWGRLALLAHQTENGVEERTCIVHAIQGTCTGDPTHHIGFNIHNSANVAQFLHEIGLSEQARDLLKYGLEHVNSAILFDITPFQSLVRAIYQTKAFDLRADALDAAQKIKDTGQKAEALLGTIHAIVESGDSETARSALPLVLDVIQESDNARLIFQFGEILKQYFVSDRECLSTLITKAFDYARMQDRPTMLMWVAGLLPVFAAVDAELPARIWHRLQRAEGVFKP